MGERTHNGAGYKGRPQKPRKTRVKVDLWCEILGAKDRAVGHIRNLTVGGCKVLSPSAFPARDTVSLVLPCDADGPDLHLKAQLRWMAINPVEGPFEIGFQFVHSGDTLDQVERLLKAEIKKSHPVTKKVEPRSPVFTKFGGGLDAVRNPGAPTTGDLRKVYAAEGLDRLLKPDPSSPLP